LFECSERRNQKKDETTEMQVEKDNNGNNEIEVGQEE